MTKRSRRSLALAAMGSLGLAFATPAWACDRDCPCGKNKAAEVGAPMVGAADCKCEKGGKNCTCPKGKCDCKNCHEKEGKKA